MTPGASRNKTRAATADRPPDDARQALTIPLAALLAEPAGVDRTVAIEDVRLDPGEGLELASPVTGAVHVARTNRGVLVHGDLRTSLAMECSRCLRPIEVPLDLAIDEEALPSVDLHSGAPVDATAEPDVVRLTDHHELELLPLVRDAILLAEPIAPLCRPDCPGLCVVCGQPLEVGSHDHPDDVDPRLAALAAFRPANGDEDEAEEPPEVDAGG